MRPAVHVDDAPDVGPTFEDENDPIRQLIDLERERRRVETRNAWRQAFGLGIIDREIRETLVVERLRPRLERNVDDALDRRSLARAATGPREVRDHARVPGPFSGSEI